MLLASVILLCPATVILNVSKFPWNDYDKQMLTYAEKRCVQIYEDSPCVKLFRKFGKQDYSVVCGAKEAQAAGKET